MSEEAAVKYRKRWLECKTILEKSPDFTRYDKASTEPEADAVYCKYCDERFCICGGCGEHLIAMEHECWLKWMTKAEENR